MGFLGGLFSIGNNNGAGFNAQQAPLTTLNNLPQNYDQTLSNQNALVNQLQAAAQGQGPNPAAQALANATSQNNAQVMSQLASAKGLNPAIAARQAAQIGAQNQQTAAGQSALMQSQQQIAARDALSQQLNGMQGQTLGAIGNQNQAQIGNLGQMNSANSHIAGVNAENQSKMFGSFINGAGAALGFADGGTVPSKPTKSFLIQHLANGGGVDPVEQGGKQMGSILGKLIGAGVGSLVGAPGMGAKIGGQLLGGNQPTTGAMLAQQPVQQPMFTLGANTQLPQFTNFTQPAYAKGGDVGSKLKDGGKVPGKAAVKGDSPKNDTVKAMLSPGEHVLTRTEVQKIKSLDDPKKIGQFIQAVMAKKGS